MVSFSSSSARRIVNPTASSILCTYLISLALSLLWQSHQMSNSTAEDIYPYRGMQFHSSVLPNERYFKSRDEPTNNIGFPTSSNPQNKSTIITRTSTNQNTTLSSSSSTVATQLSNLKAFDNNATAAGRDDDNTKPNSKLILWCSAGEPLLQGGTKSSDILLSRRLHSTLSKGRFREVEQVMDFEVRECDPQNCGALSSGHPLPENLSAWSGLHHPSWFQLSICSKLSKNIKSIVNLEKLMSITLKTISSSATNHYSLNPFFNATHNVELSHCKTSRPCPPRCPGNQYFDHRDKLCKVIEKETIPPVRHWGGPCTCTATCYTPEASAPDTTWPWKDEIERQLFMPHWNDTVVKTNIKQNNKIHRVQRRSDEQYRTYQARFACDDDDSQKIPDAIHGDYSHHLFYIPQAKLIFCGIPKVGITEWIKFFRYMMGAQDYISIPHSKADRGNFFMNSLDPSKAEELFKDPSWTKAVFFRNPLDRLLSGYMDKFLGESYTQTTFHVGSKDAPKAERPVLAFEEFVDKVVSKNTDCKDPSGLHACTDPHWKPQVMTCGLDHLLPKFDFIGNFDHISEHTRILLDKVGIWDKYGRNFDDGKGLKSSSESRGCWVPPPQRNDTSQVYGFNQRGPSGAGKNVHATSSKSKFDQYYTPELIEKVRQAYALDFAVWDEIADRTDGIASGKDLRVVQEYCQSRKEVEVLT